MSDVVDRSVTAEPKDGVRTPLQRVLSPTSIALVGLSDTSHFLKTIEPTFESDAEIFVVNPRYDTALGKKCFASLTEIERPIDCVMCCVGAKVSTAVVEEAAGLDVGGLVLVANGFGEFGDEGAEMQARLKAAADQSGLALVGPNGLGYINVRRRIHLTLAGGHPRRPGGISIVSHSGALLSGAATASWNYPDTGVNVLVSAGNEAATDLADYVNHFVDDPDTRAIGLILEKIRRPEEFFASVERATAAGKPIVALKLARSAQSQKMAASHTGALTGDAWVYDVALRQAGIALAYDVDELVDRLAFFDQLPPERWTPVRSLAVLTRTGGFASLSVDLAEAEGVPLAPLEDYTDWLAEKLPGVTVANPLDAASFGSQVEWSEILEKYVTDPQVDAVFMIGPNSNGDVVDKNGVLANPSYGEPYADAAAQVNKPCVISNVSGVPGDWIAEHLHDGVLVRGRGLRASLQGLATLGAFVRHRDAQREPLPAVAPLARPVATPVPQPEGAMLPFGATMELLAEHGIPVAPYHLVAPGEDAATVSVPFGGPYVAKLADVAHRTEHNAVRLKLDGTGLAEAIEELRAIAQADDLAATVAIQPMLEIQGEALLGVQGESELGPLVVFGLGGIFVEALNRVSGRMAPFSHAEARALIDEFADVKVMHGFRGQPAWDHDQLTEILVAAGRLAAAGRDWIASLDINPLVYGPTGFHAVDALLLLRG